MNRLVERSALRATGTVHIRVIGINRGAALAAENTVLFAGRPKAPVIHKTGTEFKLGKGVRLRERRVWLLAIFVVVGLLCALGGNTPFYPLLRKLALEARF